MTTMVIKNENICKEIAQNGYVIGYGHDRRDMGSLSKLRPV